LARDAEWVEVSSPHFSVITDAGERRGREVAIRFEQMRAVYAALMSNAKVNIPIPLEIVAFRNTKEFRQVAPLWNGKPVQLAGLFQAGSDRCFIMLDMSVENPWNVVFHEYAHQLMNGTLTQEVDPWFEEGFAEYFSTIEVDSHQARVGKIPSTTYEILQHDGLMKVADLLRVQHNSGTYNESGDRRTVFYAESAMVVHYLYDHQMIPKLAAFFDFKIDKKLPVEDAIQHAFGMSASDFDIEIRRYVSGGQYQYYYMKTPADIETKGYTTTPLSAESANAVIADVHLHSPDYHEKAMAEFEAVLKSDPNNPAALRGMGYAYLQKRDFEEAGEYFRRAAQFDSKDARVHYYSGLLMNLRGTRGTEPDIEYMTSELKTAIALDPDFADAYMQLAFAQATSSDISGALVSAHKAISLSPQNQSYYFNLADLYMQDRQTSHALGIFRALANSGDQVVAQRATAALDQVQRMEQAAQAMQGTPLDVSTANAQEERRPSNVTPGSAGMIRFLKGTIVAVDCSSSPKAVMTVSATSKSWTMQVADIRHVLVMGADAFSCNWSKQKVAVNFRETGEATGSVFSIEIQ
jgi:tetratricopeptide (TPR) repeat protein